MDNIIYNQKLIDETIEKINKNPQESENYLALGKFYIINNDYENALKSYTNLLTLDPMNFQALVNAGGIYFYKNNYKKAINFYSRALEIEPENYSIY